MPSSGSARLPATWAVWAVCSDDLRPRAEAPRLAPVRALVAFGRLATEVHHIETLIGGRRARRFATYLVAAVFLVAVFHALSEAIYQAELRSIGRPPGYGLYDSVVTAFADHPFSFVVWLLLALGGTIGAYALSRRAERGDERLAAFLQAATDTILIGTDAAGVIHLYSRGAARVLGFAEAEVVGRRTILDILLPASQDPSSHARRSTELADLLCSACTASSLRREWVCVDATGEQVVLDLTISPVRDRDGTLTGFVAVGNDITHRLRMVDALRQSNETVRAIVQSAPVAIITRDPSGKVLNWNPAAERMFGWTEAEVLGKPSPIIPTNAPSVYEKFRDRLDRGEIVTDFEVIRPRRDGTLIDVNVSAAGMRDDAGNTTGFVITLQDVTERNRALAELRESEERFRRLAEASFEGMVVSIGGRIVEANRTFAAMLGYELEEIIGQPVVRFAAPESAPKVAAAIESGRSEPYEAVAVRKDGTTFEVEILGRQLRYAGKDARVSAVRDITTRKEAERAIRASEQRYRTIMESIAEGLLLQDADGRVLASNESASRILGLTPAQIAFEEPTPPGWASIHEDGSPFLVEDYPSNVTVRTGQPCSNVVMGIVRSGERTTWISVNARPIYEPGETRPRAVVTSFVDITERKESEAATARAYVRADRERSINRAIIDAASEALLLIGEDGSVLSCNQRFWELFEIEERAIIGKPVRDLAPWFRRIFGDPATVRELIDERPRRETSKQLLTQIWPVHRELETYSTPVTGGEQQLFGRLVAFRDVTHERAVDRMKTEFVSLVSHELRTPLTSIKGYVDLMLEGEVGPLQDEQREFLEIVRNNANRLTALINDLLDVSRIESGRIELKHLPVDLERVLRDAVETLRPQTEVKGQRVILEIDDTLPVVLGDRNRLTQVFLNLVDNAHKYTPAGGEIRISARTRDEKIEVAVSDTGIGLSEEEQAEVFTKFFRARNRWTSEVRGTGLGLSIARSLVQLHGGELSVSSRIGEGTTFRVELPLRTAAAAEPPPPAPRARRRSRRLRKNQAGLVTANDRQSGGG